MGYFKILLLVSAFLFSIGPGVAQTDKLSKKEQRKIERAERKQLKEEKRIEKQEWVNSLVENQAFVLEASTIFGRYMHPYQVPPNINFVKVEGKQLTLQTANNFNFGYNGLGGITLNGTISDYTVNTTGRNDNISILIHFTSNVLGHSTLTMDINANGLSRALFVDNWGRRLTFQGQVESLEGSMVFEGMPLI